tara:strand:- start:1123 stop:1383 length:261 start_codon:yes stop_codon:yes gene_type:complete
MKLFFYKSILVFFLFIIAIHFSFGLIKNELKRELTKISSKENIEQIKGKIREEIRDGLDKDRYLNHEDAELLNNFMNKIKSELNPK